MRKRGERGEGRGREKLVPMLLGLVQGGQHERQDDLDVLAKQRQDVVVVPEVERPLGHLDRQTARFTFTL